MNTVADEWKSYYNAYGLENLSEEEQKERKKTFYAGSFIVFNKMVDLEKQNKSEDAINAILNGMYDECIRFLHNVDES
ncbi:MAG: hypothetical protein GWN00_19815 [Aliifodinibius sp.]|nr:hypothetical protein [Fodinibius sp.]NIY26970.1 hypothetical protein [Fodinibius sp.]